MTSALSGPPIILDTNVVSELARPAPDQTVIANLQKISDRSYITTIVLGELILGVELLSEGRRMSELRHHVEAVRDAYRDRTIPLTTESIENYAVNVAALRRRGITITVNDAHIAATAVTHGAVLYTRNAKDFDGYPGLELINPWDGVAPAPTEP